MKKAGLIILIIGVLITLFAGFHFVTKKKVIEIGKLEIARNEDHVLDWSPLAGVVVIALGGAVYFYGLKKE